MYTVGSSRSLTILLDNQLSLGNLKSEFFSRPAADCLRSRLFHASKEFFQSISCEEKTSLSSRNSSLAAGLRRCNSRRKGDNKYHIDNRFLIENTIQWHMHYSLSWSNSFLESYFLYCYSTDLNKVCSNSWGTNRSLTVEHREMRNTDTGIIWELWIPLILLILSLNTVFLQFLKTAKFLVEHHEGKCNLSKVSNLQESHQRLMDKFLVIQKVFHTREQARLEYCFLDGKYKAIGPLYTMYKEFQ